jgi:hypothetical protein
MGAVKGADAEMDDADTMVARHVARQANAPGDMLK